MVLCDWPLKLVSKEFCFDVDAPGYFHFKGHYRIPETIFAPAQVNIWKLDACCVKMKDYFCIALRFLQKLALRELCIDDHMMRKVVACCPLMADLSLKFCCGFKRNSVVWAS